MPWPRRNPRGAVGGAFGRGSLRGAGPPAAGCAPQEGDELSGAERSCARAKPRPRTARVPQEAIGDVSPPRTLLGSKRGILSAPQSAPQGRGARASRETLALPSPDIQSSAPAAKGSSSGRFSTLWAGGGHSTTPPAPRHRGGAPFVPPLLVGTALAQGSALRWGCRFGVRADGGVAPAFPPHFPLPPSPLPRPWPPPRRAAAGRERPWQESPAGRIRGSGEPRGQSRVDRDDHKAIQGSWAGTPRTHPPALFV